MLHTVSLLGTSFLTSPFCSFLSSLVW